MTGAISSMASGGGMLGGLAKNAISKSPILGMLTNGGSGAVSNPFSQAIAGSGGADALAGSAGPVEAPDSLPQLNALPQLELGPDAAASSPQTPPVAGSGGYRDMIAASAKRWGVNPATALAVAKSEGGLDGWIQSKVVKNGVQEPSFGPFQMLVGGKGTGFPEGMGNQLMRERGVDPRDPANAEKVLDFAMEQASKKGWGQWYGAKAAGIGNFDGIGGRPTGVSPMTANVMGGVGGQDSPGAAGAATDDPYATIFGGMFKGPTTPGEGETKQKGFMEKAMGSIAAAGGGGKGLQVSSESGGASQPGAAYDDSGEYLAQANQRINTARGANSKAEERKASIRAKMTGSRV